MPRLLFLLLISAQMGFGALSPAAADGKRVEEETRKLDQIRARIQATLESLNSQRQEKDVLQEQLRRVETSLGAKTREIRKLDGELGRLNRRLNDLNGERKSLQTTLAEQRRHLATQLRAAYFTGNQEQIKLLLNQQDPSALARVLKYYEYLNLARLDAIADAQTTLDSLHTVEAGIVIASTEREGLRRDLEQERRTLAEQRQQRQTLLTQLQARIAQDQASVEALSKDENRIRELIASLSGIFADIPANSQNTLDFAQLKGALNWPAKGTFLNRYGENRAGSDMVWRGIRISAPAGSEVRAVSHGRVAFADWLPGFGLILIIDHNQGYISLYGHNEALYKETGDWVQAGETIATIGDSGGHQQTALYFEIRHNGKPVNPQEWCRS